MQKQETFRHFIESQPYRPAQHGAVLNQQEFLIDFGHEAQKASEVFTAVMTLEAGNVGSQVIDIFRNAPEDAKKTVVFDAFSNMVSGGLILTPYAYVPGMKKEVKKRRKDQADMMTELETTGTEVRVINEPHGIKDKLFPFTGRSHLKISYVVKEDRTQTAYIHSSNHNDGISAEVAVKFTGHHAEKIIEEYDKIIDTPPNEDYSKQLTDDLWIFVDSGQPGKSIILDKAVSLAEEAQTSIHACSQLPPSGEFAKVLSEANRIGKFVEAISTRRHTERPVYSDNNMMYLVSAAARLSSFTKGYSFPLNLDPFRNVHVKLLLIDVFTENPQAFFGSHNYADSGVKAGTREVQLLSTDRKIISALQRRFEDFKLTTQFYMETY